MNTPEWQTIWALMQSTEDWRDLERKLAELPNASVSYPDLLRHAYQYPLPTSLPLLVYQMFVSPLHVAVGLHLHGRELNIRRKSADALELLRLAVHAYARANEGDGKARAQGQLGNALYMRGNYPEAEQVLEEARIYFGGREDRWFELGQVQLNSADIAMELGKAEAALALSNHAYTIASQYQRKSEPGSQPHRRALVNGMLAAMNQGWAYEEGLADLVAATVAYKEAGHLLDVLEQHYGENPDRRFRLALNMAVLELRKNHHTGATALFDEARSYLLVQEVDEDHDATAALEDWADLLSFQMYQTILQGNLTAGQALFADLWSRLKVGNTVLIRELQQKLQILLFVALMPEIAQDSGLVNVGSPGMPDYSPLILELEQTTEKLQAALRLSIGATTLPTIERFIIEVKLASLRLSFEAGLAYKAETLLAELEAHKTMCSPWQRVAGQVLALLYDDMRPLDRFPVLIEQLKQQHDYRTLAAVLRRLGQRYEANGRLNTNTQDSRDGQRQMQAAYAAYESAAQAVEMIRSGVQLSFQDVQIITQYRPIYERAFNLKAAAGEMALAWDWTERLRTQTLVSAVLNADLHSVAYVTTTPELEKVRQQMQSLRALFPSSGRMMRSEIGLASNAIMDQYVRAEQEYLRLRIAQASNNAPTTAAALTQPQTLDQAMRVLPPDTALISFQLVAGRDSDDGLWAFTLQPDGRTALINTLDRDKPLSLLQRWSTIQTRLAANDFSISKKDLRLFSSQLFAAIGPALEDLASTVTRLIIIPDEAMPVLPFHLAMNSAGSYLFENYSVSYAPSATVLAYCTERHTQRTNRQRSVLVAGWQSAVRLDAMDRELDVVCGALGVPPARPNDLSTAVLVDRLAHTSLAHLSCHGSFLPPPGHPLFAHLKLGDEMLYAHDLYGIKIATDLLVLSACDVGQHGRGLQGMVSAALTGGSSAVIAAMWPVFDNATPDIMASFYHHLAAGLPAADALRAMQIEQYKQSQLKLNTKDSVLEWGCFFLTGVPGVTI